MRALLVALGVLACAGQQDHRDAGAHPAGASPTELSSKAPLYPGIVTAADAARQRALEQIPPARATGDAGAGADACNADDDCGTTRIPDGECCESLCEPRAVSRAHAEKLAEKAKACRGCADPLCRPPGVIVRPACVQNRCVLKSQPLQD
jgi:hypothetical protein